MQENVESDESQQLAQEPDKKGLEPGGSERLAVQTIISAEIAEVIESAELAAIALKIELTALFKTETRETFRYQGRTYIPLEILYPEDPKMGALRRVGEWQLRVKTYHGGKIQTFLLCQLLSDETRNDLEARFLRGKADWPKIRHQNRTIGISAE